MATAAPNATYPVITGTATTAPASRETRRKPSPATSFAFMGASVHCLGARATYHEGQSANRRAMRATARRSRGARRVGLSDHEARDRASAGRGRSVTEAAGL